MLLVESRKKNLIISYLITWMEEKIDHFRFLWQIKSHSLWYFCFYCAIMLIAHCTQVRFMVKKEMVFRHKEL